MLNPFGKKPKPEAKRVQSAADPADDLEVIDPERERLGDDREEKATQAEIDAALLEALAEFEARPNPIMKKKQ